MSTYHRHAFRSRCSICVRSARAFTPVELVAVVSTIALLATVSLPTLTATRAKAHQAVCHMNLKELGIAWQDFADEHDGWILPAWIGPANEATYPMGCPESIREPGPWWQKLSRQAYLTQDDIDLPALFHCPADSEPVTVTFSNTTFQHSYVYMDYFGLSYSSNPDRWPGNRMYGIKQRSDVTKHPGQTPVMTEAQTGNYKAGNLVVPSGGYTNRAHRLWTERRHNNTANMLFDDGHVDAVGAEHPALTYDSRDLF